MQVLASLEADGWLNSEQDYLMTKSFRGATQQRRLHISNHRNKLFASLGPIYVSHNSNPPQSELVDLIRLNGGKVGYILPVAAFYSLCLCSQHSLLPFEHL